MFSRRRFLLSAAPLAVAAATETWSAGQEPPRRRLVPPLTVPERVTSATVPIIDFHTHLQRRVTAEYLIGRLDAVGVRRMVLGPLHWAEVREGEREAAGQVRP